jgi:hypothetical protein
MTRLAARGKCLSKIDLFYAIIACIFKLNWGHLLIIFNPLCPPVLGELKNWGTPPNPRQRGFAPLNSPAVEFLHFDGKENISLAMVRPQTELAPADLRAVAQASNVAPVVQTSSMSNICFPSRLLGQAKTP